MGLLFIPIIIFKISLYSVGLFAFITFVPGLPPNHINFESIIVQPPMKLEGKLASNTILNNVKILNLDQNISGPESIVLRGDELFTGDHSGKILKIKNGKVTTVLNKQFQCDSTPGDCSYPLGLRFDGNGKLVYVDNIGGLLRVDVDTGVVEHLLSRGEYIDDSPIGNVNDLDVSKDGTIYFSEIASPPFPDKLHSIMYGQPCGRLLKFEPSKNKTTVLINNIHFANGVQLSPNEDFVLVSELIGFRVRRYYLKGDKKGQNDIFIDGLPGMPDNIRTNKRNGFYVSLFAPRQKIDLGPYPLIRKFLLRTIFLKEYFTSTLYNNFPNELTKSIYSYGQLFPSVETLFQFNLNEPWNAFIIELNEKGEILGSLQSTNNALYGVSQMTVGETYSYFGSPINNKIWYIKNNEL